MLIDTHAHLSHHQFDAQFPYLAREGDAFVLRTGTRAQVIRELRAAGVGACVEPAIGFSSNRRLLALGTVLSMIGVGRSIAAFNALCKRPLLRAAGLEPVRA